MFSFFHNPTTVWNTHTLEDMMATNIRRTREAQLSSAASASVAANNFSTASSPAAVGDPLDSYLTDPPTHISSAPASFQNEGFFGENSVSSSDADFGFWRSEFRSNQLVGSVQFYERHVFLCYKNPSVWPPRIEAAEFDRLPRLLSAAVLARKGHMQKETRLTICEGHDGTETSNGDVLIFPDMVRYRRLTHFDVDTFVEEVLVKEGEWLPGSPESLHGSYVFVCAHGSRDRRCGVCGPPLVRKFKEEIDLHGLHGKVSVSPCSHIMGHKYAGNVIIFGSSNGQEVTGHWYGYVTPDDVSMLLEKHVGKGDIVDWLWRGQMGLSEEEQVKSQQKRLRLNGETRMADNVDQKQMTRDKIDGCCQKNGDSCCQTQNMVKRKKNEQDSSEEIVKPKYEKQTSKKQISVNGNRKRNRIYRIAEWLGSWERDDTYAAAAVICAAVSVAVAFRCYKQQL